MAIIKPPAKRKKTDIKLETPRVSAVSTMIDATPKGLTEQASPSSIGSMQLNIPIVKRNEFKAYASLRGLSMNNLFLDMFAEYKNKHD